ncbi:MAG: GNAT family N-acetyltransferase [Bauldia sp.]|nr:GNAT family N-acetyltransferase [Bauldia sp.]
MAAVSLDAASAAAARVAVPAVLTRSVVDLLPLSDICDVYRTLAGSAVADNVFLHPAFLQEAAEALGSHVELLTCLVPGGRAVAAMPVVPARIGRLAPALSFYVHDYAPLGVPLVAGEAPGAIRNLVEGAVEAAGAGRAIIFPYLPAGSAIATAIREAVEALGRDAIRLDVHERAMLDRRVDGTDPRRSLPQRRRKEYGRQMRRLHETAPVRVEVAAMPGEVDRAFEEFLALEAAGWKGRRGTAMRDLPKIATFARAAVTGLARDGACRILTLRAGGMAVAMLVVFIAGGTATTWKIAHDEAFARFSPGAQLMLEAPPLLFADPTIERIDSLAAPNHPMIDHLWRGRLALETLVIAPERNRALFRLGLALRTAEGRGRAAAHTLRARLRGRKSRAVNPERGEA